MNREQDDIDKTAEFCRNKLKNEELPLTEKQALLFYIKELNKTSACPDDQKFKKPCRGFHGSGDQMVFKNWILRDEKNNPMTNSKGELIVENCCFQDMHAYLQCIRGERKVQKYNVDFYDGMPRDEYLNFQLRKLQVMKRHNYDY